MARTKPSGLAKPVKLSKSLANIVGKPKAPRFEVTKKIWALIKRTPGAQDGRIINPSASPKLAAVLGNKPIDMLKMTKKVSDDHIIKD